MQYESLVDQLAVVAPHSVINKHMKGCDRRCFDIPGKQLTQRQLVAVAVRNGRTLNDTRMLCTAFSYSTLHTHKYKTMF